MSNPPDYKHLGAGHDTLERFASTPHFNRWQYDMVAPFLGSCVLEIGCGIGNLTEHLLAEGRTVVASDVSAEYVADVQRALAGRGRLVPLQVDAQDPDLPARLAEHPVDTIVCMSVLEHLEDDWGALRAMRRVLLPRRGRLLMYVPALSGLYGSLDRNLLHHRRYDRRPFRHLIDSAGYRIEKLAWMNLAGIPGWWLNARVLKREILPAGQLQAYDRLVPLFRLVERLTGPFIGQNLFVVARAEPDAEA